MADIPEQYPDGGAKADGERVFWFAQGLQHALATSIGEKGNRAGHCLIQAGWLFRSAEIARNLVASAGQHSAALGDTPQFVTFASGLLGTTALAGAVDLSAAALHRFYVDEVISGDPAREASVEKFPHADRLAPAPHGWLDQTRGSSDWLRLRTARHGFVHQQVPASATVGATSLYTFGMGGKHEEVNDFLRESRPFVMDRILTVGLMLHGELA